MTHQTTIRPYLRQAYFFGLMLLAVSLTLSPFMMSMAQFWLVVVWVLDGVFGQDFKAKWNRFIHNKAAVLMVAFYLLHLVGLLYTSDFQYALKDLRVKLPILILPFVLSSMEPLDRKRTDLLLNVYVFSVFVATLFSFCRYVRHDYDDIREISRFISHIRFCLHIVFCMAIIGYYVYNKRVSKGKGVPAFGMKVVLDYALMWFLLFWFGYQIFIFESLSGYVILAAVVLVSLIYVFFQWRRERVWRLVFGVSVLAAIVIGAVVVSNRVRPLLQVDSVDFSALDQNTAQGNPYWHDTVCNPVEDGKYVGLYYCRKELQEAWPLRSALPLEGTTLNGENLEATLVRYLTSKDLRKDAEGVAALTDEDIHNIEQGIANYNNWRHPGLRSRLSVTLFEYNMYRKFNNPNGGSLSQRIEFTRAAFHIIRKHPLFGVGTGDVPKAFLQAYDEIQSPLKEEFRFRAHNQYFTIMIAFGVVGLALFLVVLFLPCFSFNKRYTYLNIVFFCIMALSMLPEDTLETQAGATLFAFFYAFLMLAVPQEADTQKENSPQ